MAAGGKWTHRLAKRAHVLLSALRPSKDAADANAAHDFYAARYWAVLDRHLDARPDGADGLDVLDAGCGTGRFAIECARRGHRVTGIDYEKASLEIAARRAATLHSTATWLQGDLGERLAELPAASFDFVLCLEVLYTCPDFEPLLEQMRRVLRPGGTLAASFRPPSYFVTTLLAQGRVEEALSVVREREGLLRIATLPTYYNWQSPSEIAEILRAAGFAAPALYPIGAFSGAGVDGMARLVDVEALDPVASLDALAALEAEPLEGVEGLARYLLAIAQADPAHP